MVVFNMLMLNTRVNFVNDAFSLKKKKKNSYIFSICNFNVKV
jgi:hypothetical protein